MEEPTYYLQFIIEKAIKDSTNDVLLRINKKQRASAERYASGRRNRRRKRK